MSCTETQCMAMTDRTKFLIVSFFAAATLTYGVIIYYSTLVYIKDYIYGTYLDIAGSLFPFAGTFTVVDNREYKKYENIFSGLPRNILHAGDILIYRAPAASTLDELAPEMIRFTDYFNEQRLKNDIRKYNGIGAGVIPKGTILLIPNASQPFVPVVKNLAKPRLITARGLYFTGTSAGNATILQNLGLFRNHGINTIVFDAKDVDGVVTYYSRMEEVRKYNTHEKRTIGNIGKFIRSLKAADFYIIARIAVFHDHLLRKREPGFAIRSRRAGGVWNPESKEKWCDPTNKMVQNYNINIALELAEQGVDEIQFDYIRFPTNGDLADARFKYDFGRMGNDESITRFLERAYRKISSRNARLSIDIFGVVAWGKTVDIKSTGQRIELLSRYCDIMSPMLYPSHFSNDFDGYSRPGDNPYYFVYNGCRKVSGLAAKRVVIRPWLQAFRWHVSRFDADYIKKQIKACNDAGARGYLFWNPSNEYGTVFRALAEIGSEDRKSHKDN